MAFIMQSDQHELTLFKRSINQSRKLKRTYLIGSHERVSVSAVLGAADDVVCCQLDVRSQSAGDRWQAAGLDLRLHSLPSQHSRGAAKCYSDSALSLSLSEARSLFWLLIWLMLLQMWPDLVKKSKDGGLDVIETYVFWNLHEPVRNQVSFLLFYILCLGHWHCFRIWQIP
jgi:hypothetical protein